MCVHVCTCVYMCVYVCTCVYMCVHVCTCLYMCVHVCTCVNMFKLIVMQLVTSFQLTLLPENYNVVRHGFIVIADSAIWNRKIYI